MSALHTADLTNRLNDYLGRRQPPRSFATDDRRKADQMAAYVATLRKFAPHSDALDEWWGKFLEALSEVSDTWAWPSEGDVSNPLAVAEKRIQNDEPIGDSWLWGSNALLLIQRVGMDKVQERRDRHASHLAQTYDIEPARRMLLELEYRHSEAVKAADAERHAQPREQVKFKVKNVRDLLGPGPQYVPPGAMMAAE